MHIIRTSDSHRGLIQPVRIVQYLTISCFFLVFSVSFLKNLDSYDFWWHLATGKYIVENQSLPQEDPFSYTTRNISSVNKSIVLKGNWLAQVIFYKIYHLWDLKGIIILRALLLMTFLLFVFLNIKKQNVSVLIVLVLTAGFFLVETSYTAERPQLFTFLVFSIVYYLLEDFRINNSKRVFLIPVLVALLSNMHPGYVVCIMLTTLYFVGESIRYFFSKNYKNNIHKNMLITILIIWGTTIFSPMLNPNGALIFKYLADVHSSKHTTIMIVEFMPTFAMFKNNILQLPHSMRVYIVFLLFSLLSLRYLRRIGIVHMLLLIGFTVMSFVAIRYVIFYMCVAAPILARIIVHLKDEEVFKGFFGRLQRREGLLNVIACIIGIFLVFSTIPTFAKLDFKEETFFSFPKGAADFLGEVEIKGNMFNEYAFGGYLIWRLYPDKKVFIDGRGREPDVMDEYYSIGHAIEQPPLNWEDIIKKYNISYIITSPLDMSGRIFPIVEKLFISNYWVLIYYDHISLIFLRDDSRNPLLVKKYAKDKSEGLNTILIQASARAISSKTNPYLPISIGKVFFQMGRFDDAEKAFKMAYEIDPDNAVLKFWLEKLEANTKKIKK